MNLTGTLEDLGVSGKPKKCVHSCILKLTRVGKTQQDEFLPKEVTADADSGPSSMRKINTVRFSPVLSTLTEMPASLCWIENLDTFSTERKIAQW